MNHRPSCLRARVGLLIMLVAALLVRPTAGLSATAAETCLIPQDKIDVSFDNESGHNEDTSAWQMFKVTTNLHDLDGLPEGCQATVKIDDELFGGMQPATIYLNADGTSSATPSDDSVATMSVDPSNSSIVFTLTAFASTHQNVSAEGWAKVQINSTIGRGETAPVYAEINGESHHVTDVTGATCTTDCPAPPEGAAKWGSARPDGSGYVTIQTPTFAETNTKVTVTDEFLSPGQSITGDPEVYGYTCVNTWGDPGVDEGGTCNTGRSLEVDLTKVEDGLTPDKGGSYTFTTTVPDEFVRLTLSMQFDQQHASWKDKATVTAPGRAWSTETTVKKYSIGGGGDGDDTPTPQPGVEVVKSAAPTVDANHDGVVGDAGDTIRYRFVVTNTGDTVLTGVVVRDRMLQRAGVTVTCPRSTLRPGASMTCTSGRYTITKRDVANGQVHNVATVDSGETPPTPSNPVDVPTKPTPQPVTRTFQVDSYHWHDSAAYGRRIARLDNDGLLRYREDGFLWATQGGVRHTRTVWQIVTVTLPANATPRQWIRAINAKTTQDGVRNVRGTAKVAPTGAARGTVTVAWQVRARSWPTGRQPQALIGSSS